jgi:hypothetical protein
MLKVRFLGRGMCMEFGHPQFGTPILTSPIQEICECLGRMDSRIVSRRTLST